MFPEPITAKTLILIMMDLFLIFMRIQKKIEVLTVTKIIFW